MFAEEKRKTLSRIRKAQLEPHVVTALHALIDQAQERWQFARQAKNGALDLRQRWAGRAYRKLMCVRDLVELACIARKRPDLSPQAIWRPPVRNR